MNIYIYILVVMSANYSMHETQYQVCINLRLQGAHGERRTCYHNRLRFTSTSPDAPQSRPVSSNPQHEYLAPHVDITRLTDIDAHPKEQDALPRFPLASEEMGDLDGEDDGFLEGLLGHLQPRHVVPLNVGLLHHNSVCSNTCVCHGYTLRLYTWTTYQYMHST